MHSLLCSVSVIWTTNQQHVRLSLCVRVYVAKWAVTQHPAYRRYCLICILYCLLVLYQHSMYKSMSNQFYTHVGKKVKFSQTQQPRLVFTRCSFFLPLISESNTKCSACICSHQCIYSLTWLKKKYCLSQRWNMLHRLAVISKI